MKPTKCLGMLGRLFGHKFTWGGLDQMTRETTHCLRCGMPKGGWSK